LALRNFWTLLAATLTGEKFMVKPVNMCCYSAVSLSIIFVIKMPTYLTRLFINHLIYYCIVVLVQILPWSM